jgi:phosphoglycolate phosphatase
VKAVFFDWDGTLVDSLGLLFNSHNHVRGVFGLPLWTREEYSKAMASSTRELYPSIYGDRALEAQGVLYEFIKANHLDHLKLMPGAVELLDMLLAMNVPMGVLSNKRNDVLVREVESLGWQKYFDVYIGAGVAEKDKPSPIPLHYCIGLHKAKPVVDALLYVGDTETDLRCARDAGAKLAYVQHDKPRPDLIAMYRPEIAVNNLAELKLKLIEFLQS